MAVDRLIVYNETSKADIMIVPTDPQQDPPSD